MSEAVQVSTTVSEQPDAERIAAYLVAKKLAACVQVMGPIESTYQWKGNVESSQEWLCTAKTLRSAYKAVEAAIREIHSYDEPEIIAVPIIAGSEGYLRWLEESVEDAAE